MVCYHGTTVRGLSVLIPFASSFSILKKPLVCLSANKPMASIHIWNRPYKWMTFEMREDGVPVYNESFPGSLAEFYAGVQETGIRHACVSEAPGLVKDCELVPDAYEKLLACAREGALVINRFGKLSAKQLQSTERMVLSAIRRLSLLEGKHPLSGFVMVKFPRLWERAIHIKKVRTFRYRRYYGKGT